jgi:hypothetical protein
MMVLIVGSASDEALKFITTAQQKFIRARRRCGRSPAQLLQDHRQ